MGKRSIWKKISAGLALATFGLFFVSAQAQPKQIKVEEIKDTQETLDNKLLSFPSTAIGGIISEVVNATKSDLFIQPKVLDMYSALYPVPHIDMPFYLTGSGLKLYPGIANNEGNIYHLMDYTKFKPKVLEGVPKVIFSAVSIAAIAADHKAIGRNICYMIGREPLDYFKKKRPDKVLVDFEMSPDYGKLSVRVKF